MTGTGPPEYERLAREHFERLFDDGTVDHAVLAEGFRLHANGHEPRTPEEQLTAIEAYREAFPDLGVEIEDSFATADRVAIRATVTGTHEGAFIEIARRIPRPLRSGRKPTLDDANHAR